MIEGEKCKKPRLTEFMMRGIPLKEALDILRDCDEIGDADKRRLGFTSLSDQEPESASLSPSEAVGARLSARNLRVVQGGLQSAQGSELCTQVRAPDDPVD
jgi:hypothetical protein